MPETSDLRTMINMTYTLEFCPYRQDDEEWAIIRGWVNDVHYANLYFTKTPHELEGRGMFARFSRHSLAHVAEVDVEHRPYTTNIEMFEWIRDNTSGPWCVQMASNVGKKQIAKFSFFNVDEAFLFKLTWA